MLEDMTWWKVVFLPAAIASVPGFLKLWQWYRDRHDRQANAGLTREQQMNLDLDKRAARLAKEDADLFERARSELARIQKRCLELEDDRDRTERERDRERDLARYWNRKAYDMQHAGVNAQAIARNLMFKHPDLPMPDWPDMTLPAFEDPVPSRT